MTTPSKDELERQKLALEIRELQRRWWQRPAYLLPIVLGSLTVLAGILSGFFNLERWQLQRDINALRAEKSALIEKENAFLEASKAVLKQIEEMEARAARRAEQRREELETIKRHSPVPLFEIPTPTPTTDSN